MALSASIPLSDAFPWSVHVPSTIVVVNLTSAATSVDGSLVDVDGRFVLYQIVAAALSHHSTPAGRDGGTPRGVGGGGGGASQRSARFAPPPAAATNHRRPRSSRVLWLSSKPVTPRHIAQGLKKVGLTHADDLLAVAPPPPPRTTPTSLTHPSPPQPSESARPSLVVRCLVEEMARALRKEGGRDNRATATFDPVEYMKQNVHESVKAWISEGANDAGEGGESEAAAAAASSWIVIDDVDTLAALVGGRLASGWLQSVQALAVAQNIGLVVQCCSCDDDNDDDDRSEGQTMARGGWVGASSHARTSCAAGDDLPLSPLLAEMADYLVDVVPLRSGPTRDAHGRLIFTSVRDGMASARFNYCLADNKATAIRIRQQPSR